MKYGELEHKLRKLGVKHIEITPGINSAEGLWYVDADTETGWISRESDTIFGAINGILEEITKPEKGNKIREYFGEEL